MHVASARDYHLGADSRPREAAPCISAYARGHARDPRYSFGTGKVGALGGFASAVGLAVVALTVLGQSLLRLASPVAIRFDDAILVACVGLVVNVGCALLLHEHEEMPEGEGRVHHHHDHNLRAAYLHVLADGLTSLLAILALGTGKLLGWTWMDPLMGIAGALVIARWSYALLRDTSSVLLDAEVGEERRRAIRAALEADADNRVADLHLWRVGPRHLAALVSVVTQAPRDPAHYRQLLVPFRDLVHVTVEVQRCEGGPAGT